MKEDKPMGDKPYTTYEQQLNILKRKKLDIPDEGKVISLLKEHGYFALVSGYKAPFKAGNQDYKAHVKIDDIFALYSFDTDLRALLLKYILKIENHMKSLISYAFCDAYGDDQQAYLNVNNYEYNPINQMEIISLVSSLNDVVNHPQRYPYMYHQKKKHGNIPLWVLLKALTMGTISKMYSCFRQPIQQKICKEFEHVVDTQLTGMIALVSRFRNVCAHNERLYDYKYNKGGIENTNIHQTLNLRVRNGQYEQGKNDLFAIVIVFKYMLGKQDFDEFITGMETLIEKLSKETNCIQKPQLLSRMGFPVNWKDIKECQK